MDATDIRRTIQDLPWTENGETVENIDLATAAELLEISERQLRRDRIAVENVVGKKLERRVSGRLYLHWENVLLINEYRRIGVDAFADRHKPVTPELNSDRYRGTTEAVEAEVVAEDVDVEIVQSSGLPLAITPVVALQIQHVSYEDAIDQALACLAVNEDQRRINNAAERQEYLRKVEEDEKLLFLQEVEARNRARQSMQARLASAKKASATAGATGDDSAKKARRKAS